MKDRCQIKTHLLRDYQASSEAYSKAVVDLSRTIGTGSMFEVRETEVRDEEARKIHFGLRSA
jgi:hypothetical protein